MTQCQWSRGPQWPHCVPFCLQNRQRAAELVHYAANSGASQGLAMAHTSQYTVSVSAASTTTQAANTVEGNSYEIKPSTLH